MKVLMNMMRNYWRDFLLSFWKATTLPESRYFDPGQARMTESMQIKHIGSRPNYQQGQVLLILVLVMVAALTIALSVATRNITNLRATNDEEFSQRAFTAAEAGVERALANPNPPSTFTGNFGSNDSDYSVNVTTIGQNNVVAINGGDTVYKDEGADVWLVPHKPNGDPDYSAPWNGTLTFYWGTQASGCNDAALEVILIHGASLANAVAYKYVVDPCSGPTGRTPDNKFNPANPAGGNPGFPFTPQFKSDTITVQNGWHIRVVPTYKDTKVGVVASTNLPKQGDLIDSNGTAGDTKRRIQIVKGYPKVPPEIFQYLIFEPQ